MSNTFDSKAVKKWMSFDRESIDGIRSGKKTMTRRIINPQPGCSPWSVAMVSKQLNYRLKALILDTTKGLVVKFVHCIDGNSDDDLSVRCKYRVGDIIYVKERCKKIGNEYLYQADMPEIGPDVYSPAFLMPRNAARYFLKITGISAERICDISQEDACREGIYDPCPHRPASTECTKHADGSLSRDCFKCAYRIRWNQINGPRGHQWDKNEWVWVYSFEFLNQQ